MFPLTNPLNVWIFLDDMSGGQNCLLLAMDMAKVGGPLSVVKVCTSMLCVKIGYRMVSVSGWSPIGCEGFHTNLNIPSPPPTNYFSLPLTLSVTHMDFIWCLLLFSVNSWIRYRKIMEHLWVMIQWVHSRNIQKTVLFFWPKTGGPAVPVLLPPPKQLEMTPGCLVN